jgi:tellurite methyltransferase
MDLPSLNTRWDVRYPTEDPELWKRPSRFLVDRIPAIPVGRALDVACGPARNAVFLARRGFVVDGVDNSRAGLTMARRFITEMGTSVNLIFADLDRYAIRPSTYDLVINLFYLNRAIIPDLIRGLKDGGYLIFESFTIDTFRFMPGKERRHYLEPNELLDLVRGMRVLHFSEGTIIEAGMARATARLLARKEPAGGKRGA